MNETLEILPITYPFDMGRLKNVSAECMSIIESTQDYYDQHQLEAPFIAYLIVKHGEACGTCSFVNAINEGEIEIAYWTFPTFEGNGVATFACQSLIRIAEESLVVKKIFAKTEPLFNASTTILSKNGFAHTKEVEDHEIGTAWYWEKSVNPL